MAAKRALWITCGPRNNAGDALLHEVTEKLFDGLIDLDLRYVNEPGYIRLGDDATENVVIGPGGLLVQTQSSRHLHAKLDEQWRKLRRKTFHLWSTGILEQPTEAEIPQVRRVTDRAAQIVVRASKEAEFIRQVSPGTSPTLQPCASLFADRLLGVGRRKRDVVVVNFDEFLFTETNIADHPLRRFKEYAESHGLEVRSMVNAAGDSNRLMLDLFPLIDIDRPHLEDFLRGDPAGREFNAGFNSALANYSTFGERYLDARFAFGKRLHGWLPFLAFDTPAAFIGMKARRGMPRDYFGDTDFLCQVPRKRNMTRDDLDVMADRMIIQLRRFIKRERELEEKIAERRGELWEQLQGAAVQFAAGLR